MVGRGGFEPPKSATADLQSAPFGHSGTYPCTFQCGKWSRRWDLNPQPADYKSAALPIELRQPIIGSTGDAFRLSCGSCPLASATKYIIHEFAGMSTPFEKFFLISAGTLRPWRKTAFQPFYLTNQRAEMALISPLTGTMPSPAAQRRSVQKANALPSITSSERARRRAGAQRIFASLRLPLACAFAASAPNSKRSARA